MARKETIHILYMEDDPGLSRLFQRALTVEGFEVSLAENGKVGMAMYDEGTYHILVVDLMMPVMGGMDVIRSLAEQGEMPPTIMVTGAGSESVAVEAMKLGAADYLIKDSDHGYLELMPSVIQRILRNRDLQAEKKKAEKALIESEERFKGIAELLPQLVYEVSANGTISFMNRSGLSAIGYSEQDLKRGLNIQDIFTGPSRPKIIKCDRRLDGFFANGGRNRISKIVFCLHYLGKIDNLFGAWRDDAKFRRNDRRFTWIEWAI